MLTYFEDFTHLHDPRPFQYLTYRKESEIMELGPRLEQLEDFKSELAVFIKQNPYTMSSIFKLRQLIDDAEHLASLYRRAILVYEKRSKQLQLEKQTSVLSAQLEEARESKASALGVNRLTKLAFIYIPLNFATSALGMNLTIFGTGDVPFWAFCLLAAILVLLTSIPLRRQIMNSIEQAIVEFILHLRLTAHPPMIGGRSVTSRILAMCFPSSSDH
jgi:hypothetical protein